MPKTGFSNKVLERPAGSASGRGKITALLSENGKAGGRNKTERSSAGIGNVGLQHKTD